MKQQILSEEFRRMQFLAGIITENNINEEEIDFSDLNKVDDILKQELEKAIEQSGEINNGQIDEVIFSSVVLALAMPGIINGFTKLVKTIISKTSSKFNLSKNDKTPKLDFIINFTGKIDDYLDTPIRIALKPFINNQEKRDKIAKFLKGIVLIIASGLANIDMNQAKDISNFGQTLIQGIIPDNFIDLVELFNKTPEKFILKIKQVFNK